MSTISSNFTTSLNYVVYRIVVTEISQSTGANASVVRVEVQAKRTTQGLSINGGGKVNVIMDGRTYTQDISPTTLISSSFVNIFMQDFVIEHKPDGSKIIYVAASIDNDPIFSNFQGFNVTLTRINRQATITAVSSSFSESEPLEMTYENLSGYALDSLQACVSLDGQTPFTSLQSINLRELSAKKILVLSQADYNKLNMQFPNSKKERVYVLLISKISGINYFSAKATNYKVVNASPTISGASYKDTNSAMIAITGNNQKIVQNKSTIQFTISSIKAQKYSTLTMLTIDINGKIVSSPLSGTSISNKTVSFGITGVSQNTKASISVTDSRGFVTTQKINITVLAWSLPTAIISLNRKNNFYDETYLKANATFSSLDNNNTLSIQYKYKESESQNWSNLTSLTNNQEIVLELDNTKSFDFQVILTDRIGTKTYNLELARGIPIIFFDRLLRAVGVGTLPDAENRLVCDRKFGINNLEHERIFEIVNTYRDIPVAQAYRSSALRVKSYYRDDEEPTTAVSIYGVNDGGQVQVYGRSAFTNTIIDHYSIRSQWSGHVAYKLELDTLNGNGGSLYLYNASDETKISLIANTGKITCVSLTQTSSRKVKENIKPLTADEAYKILELVAVTFDFIEKAQGVDMRGFIAEDVAEVIPELVTPETEQTNAALDYIQMIPYLQTVIKDQEQRLRDQEKKIQEREIHSAKEHKKGYHIVYKRRIKGRNTCLLCRETSGSNCRHCVTHCIIDSHTREIESHHRKSRQTYINCEYPTCGNRNSGVQFRTHRAHRFCSKKINISQAKDREYGDRKEYNPQASHPVSHSAPEEQAVRQGFYIVKNGGTSGRKSRHCFKKGIGYRGYITAQIERQGSKKRKYHPAKSHHNITVLTGYITFLSLTNVCKESTRAHHRSQAVNIGLNNMLVVIKRNKKATQQETRLYHQQEAYDS